MMNSDKNPETDLEEEFQRTLSLDNILQEMAQENTELEALYLKSVDDLPIIDDFYIGRQDHSSGGMKRVEQAIDKSSSRKVALAWPKDQNLSLKDKVIFLNEARISSILEHPNIIPVYHLGRNQQGMPAFVMKWLDGMSLEQYLSGRGDRKNIQELLGLLIKVCEAVEYAHDRGVIHLDLKPGNIQLGDFGEVLVLDWGLARLQKTTYFSEDEVKVHESIEDFLNRQLRGTLDYISPEQKSGEEPSISMDIYALGIIIKNVLDYCSTEISESDYKTIDSIASKASANQIEDRYESVSALRNDIQDFLLGFAVEAESPGMIKLLRLFIYRHKPVFYTASFAFLMLIVLTLVFINNLRKSEAGERLSRKKAEKALEDYKSENELKKDLLEKLSVYSSQRQREQQFRLNFEGAIKNLEYLTELDSNNSSVWFQLGRLKLTHMDFPGAIKSFDKAAEIGGQNVNHILRFKGMAQKYSYKQEWQASDYLEFFKDCYGFEFLQASLCSYVYSKLNIEDGIEFFKKALKVRNPEAVLQYELRGTALSIDLSSSKKLRSLSAAAGLAIERLNLSNTTGIGLKFFQNPALKYIDISNTGIDELLENPQLKELKAQSLMSDELRAGIYVWESLKRIDLSGSYLNDWKFLNYCKNLEVLDVSKSNFSFDKIRLPLKLKSLVVSEAQITNRKKLNKLQERGVSIDFR